MGNRELNCKRGDTNTCTYVPGSVLDNMCVTLNFATFLQKSRERERERQRKRETERERKKEKGIERQGAKR